MREIKFRQPIKGILGEFCSWHYWGYIDGKFISPQPTIFQDDIGESYEYTGLKDKNGKEIYDGDTLKDDIGDILEVKFGKLPLDKSGDCVCTYQSFYCKNHGQLGQSPFYECQNIGGWMEVIGNIYENSELTEMK